MLMNGSLANEDDDEKDGGVGKNSRNFMNPFNIISYTKSNKVMIAHWFRKFIGIHVILLSHTVRLILCMNNNIIFTSKIGRNRRKIQTKQTKTKATVNKHISIALVLSQQNIRYCVWVYDECKWHNEWCSITIKIKMQTMNVML